MVHGECGQHALDEHTYGFCGDLFASPHSIALIKDLEATDGLQALAGVLGGMGPLATLDFLNTLLKRTPVTPDQDHVPTVVWNVPQIPDRQKALAGTGEDPLPAMREGIERLGCIGMGRD